MISFFIVEGSLNNLWLFNITTKWWTWVSGSDTAEEPGRSGVRGVASATNVPGARSGHAMVIDTKVKVISVYGGNFYDDLWLYNITTGWWVWLSGSGNLSVAAAFGQLGVDSHNNQPGGRTFHSMVLDDITRMIYTFGGWRFYNLGTAGMRD